MEENLIPFGLDLERGTYRDVFEVPRGRACGCICPSCKSPLIANQGELNRWYFSHASRSVYEKTQEACEYSFFVSVRMMARQIIEESLLLGLPKCEGKV